MGDQSCKIHDRMKNNDKFVGDLLATFEKSMGLQFNNIVKPEDPKYKDPKKVNLKRKLRKAERKQNKLQKLSPDEAKKVRWQTALDKAKGVKVKDDPKLIKKAIKRKQDEKRKHRKKWAERTNNKKTK